MATLMEVLSLTNKLLIVQMKTSKLFLAVAVVLTLGATSCKKEERGVRLTSFYASSEENISEDDNKTYLDGGTMYWYEGDLVKVWGSNDSRGYIYESAKGGEPSTKFEYARTGSAPILDVPFSVGYPSDYWSDRNILTLPSTQQYAYGSVEKIPQYAYSESSEEFTFRNTCGLVRLNLTHSNTNIQRISITTNSHIYGEFSVTMNNKKPSLTYVGSGGKTVSLVCPNPQSISNGRNFYIYLPPRTYSRFEIVMTTDDNRTVTKIANGAIVVERSKITSITLNQSDLSFDDSYPCLSGLFSVSASKQVKFSGGNLQCINGTWRCAINQYDYLGSYSSTAWDLFGWSTETTDYGMSASTDNDDYSSDFWDWGTAINPGAANTPWRTLLDDEWTYLLSGRTNATNLWGMATITIDASTTVQGLVLLPDNWTTISTIPFAARGSVNANRLSLSQWSQMESNGAVFLPAAGNRNGTTLASTGANGNYWTATSASNTNAYYMGFASATPSANRSGGRHTGRAVRLVQDAN